MSVKRRQFERGTGITKRETGEIEVSGRIGPDERKALEELRRAPSLKIEDNKGRKITLALRHLFSDDAAMIEARARSVLTDFRGHIASEDSREGYALRQLQMIRTIRGFTRVNDADAALHWAVKLGALLMQEEMKFAHEPAAMTGTKQRRTLAETRERVNRQRRHDRSQEWARWQSEAEKVWNQRPQLSRNAVAAQVKSKLKLADAVGTIADRIKKPGEAG
jgi:methionine aminopeptidase